MERAARCPGTVGHGIGQIRDVLRNAGHDDDVLQTVHPTVDAAIAAVGRGTGPRGDSAQVRRPD